MADKKVGEGRWSRGGDSKASEATAVPRKRMAAGFHCVSFRYFVCMCPGFVHLCHLVIFPSFHLDPSFYSSCFHLFFSFVFYNMFPLFFSLRVYFHCFMCFHVFLARHQCDPAGATAAQKDTTSETIHADSFARGASDAENGTRLAVCNFTVSQPPMDKYGGARVVSLFTTHHHSARAVWPFLMLKFLLFSAAFVGLCCCLVPPLVHFCGSVLHPFSCVLRNYPFLW